MTTAAHPLSTSAAPSKPARLHSLDTLRGFDMLWIMGGQAVVLGLHHAMPGFPGLSVLERQMDHVPWEGFQAFDLIFPLFLFLAGVSFPFSLQSRRSRGESDRSLHRHLLLRALILVTLGFVYNGVLRGHLDEFRFASVLARIGLAGCAASLIAMHWKLRGQIAWFFAILIGYFVMMKWIPVPGFGAGNFTEEGNLAAWVDRHYLPGKLYGGVFDPEGILSTLPAVATGLLGVLAGQWLHPSNPRSPHYKAGGLAVAGVVSLAAGMAWSPFFPINKALWSSSFVLVAGGWSLLLLALFYFVIDVRGLKGWTFPFVVIGLNSITIYLGQSLIPFGAINENLFSGLWSLAPEQWIPFCQAVGYLALSWLFLYLLYRQRWFLRV